MKKFYIVLTLAAALFAISCSNQEEYGQFPTNEVRFTAAQADVSLSKTVLQSDGAVFWSEGDAINLFYGTDGSAMFTSENQEPAQQATFTGSLGDYSHNDSAYFHAVYPYSTNNTFDGSVFTITLPEVQSSVAGSFADDLFISLARSQDYTLEFYNLCGGVEFSVAEAGIKYVTFSGNNNEPLAGKVKVIFNEEGKPVVQNVVEGETELRLDAPDGGTFEPGQWYYIISLPTTLSAGYTMTFYKDEKYAERVTDSSISIKRAVWGCLADADDVPVTIPSAVDLGLPSGLKWASYNVGASAPEEYGDYFAWGETEPNYTSQNPVTWKDGTTGFDWVSYKFRTSGNSWDSVRFSKYNTSSSCGPIDNKTILDLEDDAAYINWGDSWRIPTDDEWIELRTECTRTWTTQNGVSGYLFTGPNNNSIFLPATGSWEGDSIYGNGSDGYYWSSSLVVKGPYSAWRFNFNDVDFVRVCTHERFYGSAVRPVSDEGVCVSVTGVSINEGNIDLFEGATASLIATVTPTNATQRNVIWSSSNTSVATVDYTGKVTAVAVGTAVITATTYDGGYTAVCMVSVKEPTGGTIDLSVNGTANCYVVPNSGEFSFDASVMGNGPEGYIWDGTQGLDLRLWPYQRDDVYFEAGDKVPYNAFVIWDDNNVITDVKYNAKTKRISFTATGNKGNALIGLFDRNATAAGAKASTDEALWSWHIWCTDTPQIFIIYDDNENGYEIQDRNLGAISADPNADSIEDTYGLFYQFGRKDPLRGYAGIAADLKAGGSGIKYSVNHPTFFFSLTDQTKEWYNHAGVFYSQNESVCADLWGNPAWKNAATTNPHPYQAMHDELKKTIYDPCPPGYMVPPETAWTGIDTETITLTNNGVIIPTDIEGSNSTIRPNPSGSFYPFAGYISDLNSWEDNTMGYYAYNGCTITTGRESKAARVYSSYTGLYSPWAMEEAQNHYGGCSLSVHFNDGDTEYLKVEPMYQSNRQNGYNVRCMRGLIVPVIPDFDVQL